MSVWEVYWALLVVVVVGWLFGVGYRRLTEESHWTALKAELKSVTARAKTLEIAAKGAAAELDEVRGKFESLELEKARLAAEAGRVSELEKATAELREELSRAQEARASAEARVDVAVGDTKLAQAEQANLRRRLEAFQAETTRLRTEAERAGALEGALNELRGELARAQQERAAEAARASSAEAASRTAEAELSQVRGQTVALEVEIGRLRPEVERLPAVEQRLSELQEELARTRQERAAEAARASSSEAVSRTTEAELSRLRGQIEALELENGRLRSEAERLPALQQRLSEAQQELAGAESARLDAQRSAEQLDDARASLEFARSKLAAYSEERSRLESAAGLVPGLQDTVAQQQARLEQLRSALSEADAENARLAARVEAVAASAEERQAVIEEARTIYAEAFRSLSAEAIESSRQAFLEEARTAFGSLQRSIGDELRARETAIDSRLGPINDVVARLQSAVRELEVSRLENRAALSDDVEALRTAQEALRTASSQLVQAPRAAAPPQRTVAAPIPLERLLEMTGLRERCSFEGAAGSPNDPEGLRPEVTIELSGGRTTVIDSRVPLDAYLASLQVDDRAGREELLKRHAAQMRRHVERLALQPDGRAAANGFVIMYVPVEDALSAALEVDPEFVHRAVESSVIPAGPVTLLTHLKTAAWTAEAAERRVQGGA